MASPEANLTRRGRALLLLVLFALGLACLALPEAAESGVATEWVRRYNGPANGEDQAKVMSLDSQGNVCVSGFSARSGSEQDYLTIKYSPKGKRLWARRYSGPGNKWSKTDQATAIAVDGQDNVYVTGWSAGHSGNGWATIKYSPNGVPLWVCRYNEGSMYNPPVSLAIDAQGNAYVTGSSYGNETGSGYATIKYSPNGKELWVRLYNGPGNVYGDKAAGIALDSRGNVCVTGSSDGGFETHKDYLTIKYSPDGDELWVRRYNGPANSNEWARAIAVDRQGNVYVTGESVRRTYDHTNYRDSSYLTVKYDPNGQFLWAQYADGRPYEDCNRPTAMAVDGKGNVSVTGVTGYYYAQDVFTIKYGADGQPLWSRLYNGPTNYIDGAAAITMDGQGNVFITGWSDSASFYGDSCLTIKYTPDGVAEWVTRYKGIVEGDHWGSARAIAVDAQGHVYVAGTSGGYGTNYDWVTIKYLQSPRTGR